MENSIGFDKINQRFFDFDKIIKRDQHKARTKFQKITVLSCTYCDKPPVQGSIEKVRNKNTSRSMGQIGNVCPANDPARMFTLRTNFVCKM